MSLISITSCTPPTGDPDSNLVLTGIQTANLLFAGLQAGTQPTEPHQPGPKKHFQKKFWYFCEISVRKLTKQEKN